MLTMDRLKEIMKIYVGELKSVYSDCLIQVSLFGSYARGDYRNDSDIDVFVLVKGMDCDLEKFSDKFYEMSFEFNMKYDVDIQTVVMSTEYYNKWKYVHPLLLNIKEDEVRIYDAA